MVLDRIDDLSDRTDTSLSLVPSGGKLSHYPDRLPAAGGPQSRSKRVAGALGRQPPVECYTFGTNSPSVVVQPGAGADEGDSCMMRASSQRAAGLSAPVVVLALLLQGCGSTEGPDSVDSDETESSNSDGTESADYVIDLMRQRAESFDGSSAYDSLVGALPLVTYRGADGVVGRVSSSVVLGRFESADAGLGFIATVESETEAVTEVAFDDPAAQWRTIHARFTQTEVVAGADLASDGSLTLGFAVGTQIDAARFGESLHALGDVLVFVTEDSPVFAYEPGLLSVAGDGALVAVIDESGDLALPFVTPFRADSLLADVPTLEQLRIAAQAPETMVDLDALGRPVTSG